MPDEKPNDQTSDNETSTPSAEEMLTQLTSERERNTQLTARIDRLEGLLIQAGLGREGEEEGEAETPSRRAAEPRDTGKADDELPDNVDDMSTKDLVLWTLKKMGREVESRLERHAKELDAKINRVSAEAEMVQLVGEIEGAMEAHPDLLEYQKPVVALMRDNPKLSVEDAYYLAKRRAGKTDEGASKDNGRRPAPETGQLPRGSSKPASGKPEPPVKNTMEAVERAWKKLGIQAT